MHWGLGIVSHAHSKTKYNRNNKPFAICLKQSMRENRNSRFTSHHWRRSAVFLNIAIWGVQISIPSWKLILVSMTTFTYYNNLQHCINCRTPEHLKKMVIILGTNLPAVTTMITINLKQWRIVLKMYDILPSL